MIHNLNLNSFDVLAFLKFKYPDNQPLSIQPFQQFGNGFEIDKKNNVLYYLQVITAEVMIYPDLNDETITHHITAPVNEILVLPHMLLWSLTAKNYTYIQGYKIIFHKEVDKKAT